MTAGRTDDSNDLMAELLDLPPLARRAIARALLMNATEPDVGLLAQAEPPDPWRTSNTYTEANTVGRVLSDLASLVERIQEAGPQAPMTRIGQKSPHAAVLVSGEHVWDLVTLADELTEALAALAAFVPGFLGDDLNLTAAAEKLLEGDRT